MPSVSKKQHNLMAAVAHNAAFAKKVGIPQSVGKEFNQADKMKRKKFDEGGDVDPDVTNTEAASKDETPTPARQLPASSVGTSSFGQAFRDARNSGAKTFTWRGKSYTTDMAPRKTTLLPKEGQFSMLKGKAPTLDAYNKSTGTKYAKGGSVSMTKKVAGFFAKKGDKALAAHENREAKGKEEDTKAIAKREEKALKGAPKAMKNYEKKEHKAMGFKKGGMPKMPKPRKAGGINPAMLAAMAGPPGVGGGAPPGPMAAGPGAAPGMGMKKGGKACGMKKGGLTGKQLSRTNVENKGGSSKIGGGIESKGSTKTRIVSSGRGMGIAQSGTRPAKGYAKGGGIESKGKTRGRFC
jgi:hypothetical protein